MDVRIGPVSAASATAWVRYAEQVLASGPGGEVPAVDPDTVAEFRRYLTAWDDHAAHHGDPFVWSGTIEPERLEYLTHSFARIVDHLAAMANRHGAAQPAEGEEFYQALVISIIDALAQEGNATGEFSEQLRDRWPGLSD
jgi:hypothetical protein